MRYLVFLFLLSTSSAFAESHVVEVCKPGSNLIHEINDGQSAEYLINARHYLQDGGYPVQLARHDALAALLREPDVVLNATGGGPFYNVMNEVDLDGAVLERAVGGTLHDCILVHTGDRAWRRLLDAGHADR